MKKAFSKLNLPSTTAAFSRDGYAKWALGLAVASAVSVLVASSASHAGTSGTEFQIVYDTITDWVSGYLGRAIAISFLIVGLFLGIARQSIFALAVAGACGFGLLIAPAVLDNILTATVSDETFVIDAVAPEAAPVAMIAAE